MDFTKIHSGKTFLFRFIRVFKPDSLFPAVAAGITSAVLVIASQISFAAMLFSQNFSSFLVQGIGFLLFGTFILGIINAVKSSHPNCMVEVQDAPIAILSFPLITMGAQMAADAASQETIFYTIVLTLMTSTLGTGLFMLVIARFKLGNLVRFTPYPVIGGFLAGIGWILFKGGIDVMAGFSVDLHSFSQLLEPMTLLKWVPGLVFGLFLYYLLRKFNHFLILPGMVVGAIILFFIILNILGISFAQAESAGWFLGPFPTGSLWEPISLSGLSLVRWDLILAQSFTICSIFIISTISLLLNASGLELITKTDIDLDNELATNGIANILASFVGSSPGYITLSTSALSYRLTPGSRLSGIITFSICGCVLITGASIFSGYPRLLAGAMLVLIGFDMLWEWLYDSFGKLPKTDYCIILVIIVVIAGVGFLEGIATGIFIAVILFVINYSRINIIKSSSSAKHLQSNVERSVPYRWILNKKGDQVLILQLHGFIFFGSANQLKGRIECQVDSMEKIPLKYIVMDFQNVNGFDSSALNSFERIRQYTQDNNISLVFVNITTGLKKQFEKSNFTSDRINFFGNLDHGLEWCENKIIESEATPSRSKRDEIFESTFDDIDKALEQMENFERLLSLMDPCLQQIHIKKGQFLFQKGEPIQGFYFIKSGQVSIMMDQEENNPTRLREMGPGNIIGQWDEGEGNRVIPSVKIQKSGEIFYLSTAGLGMLEKNDLELSFKFYKYMTQNLSERLSKSNNIIQGLI